ncbi:Cyclin-D4-1 [Camellia lanceoleosa]|uniref:Cyclin-D4-1 n=1 Tax=Camellia lanceoleosa TaxID=1840588 RepID=A0ACC0I2B6_9ERIC|nr:Cyclin-D4-1 [Camellia lanceoleosa]
MQLLSVACLSLATKMEEYRVPSLSEFQLECNFESKVIQRMEHLVLNALEWRMSSVTPFAVIHYFIKTLGNHHSPPRNVVSRTVKLILAIMRAKEHGFGILIVAFDMGNEVFREISLPNYQPDGRLHTSTTVVVLDESK